jgi:hypothetical protein
MRLLLGLLLALVGGTAAAPAGGPSTLAWLPEGAGEGAVGFLPASESSPEGPAAVAVARDGTIALLDGVDGTIERMDADGRSRPSIPLPGPAFEDLVALPDGGFLLLDRLVERRVVHIDARGEVRGSWPLPAEPESGLITALLWAEGAHIEVEHGSSWPLLDQEFAPVARPVAERGRPDAFGRVRARLFSPRYVTLVATVDGAEREAAVALSGDALRLVAVERRPGGGLFVLAELAPAGRETGGPLDRVVSEGVWLDGALKEERRARLEHPWEPAQPLRSVAIGPDDRAIQAIPEPGGLRLVRW